VGRGGTRVVGPEAIQLATWQRPAVRCLFRANNTRIPSWPDDGIPDPIPDAPTHTHTTAPRNGCGQARGRCSSRYHPPAWSLSRPPCLLLCCCVEAIYLPRTMRPDALSSRCCRRTRDYDLALAQNARRAARCSAFSFIWQASKKTDRQPPVYCVAWECAVTSQRVVDDQSRYGLVRCTLPRQKPGVLWSLWPVGGTGASDHRPGFSSIASSRSASSSEGIQLALHRPSTTGGLPTGACRILYLEPRRPMKGRITGDYPLLASALSVHAPGWLVANHQRTVTRPEKAIRQMSRPTLAPPTNNTPMYVRIHGMYVQDRPARCTPAVSPTNGNNPPGFQPVG
jgi:hypothetical protein